MRDSLGLHQATRSFPAHRAERGWCDGGRGSRDRRKSSIRVNP